jgi:Tfp pilus assembly protein PilO
MSISATQTWYAAAAAASVGVLAAGYFLLVSPQQGSAADITAQADSVTQSNVAAQAQIQALKLQYKNLPTLEAKVAAIRVRLPETPQEPALLRSLSALATSAGATLQSVQFQAPAALGAAPVAGAPAMQQIALSITTSGTFAQTQLFINGLENLPRSMLLTAVDVSRGGAGDTSSSGATSTSTTNSLTTVVTSKVFMAATPSVASVGGTSATGTSTTGASNTHTS